MAVFLLGKCQYDILGYRSIQERAMQAVNLHYSVILRLVRIYRYLINTWLIII